MDDALVLKEELRDGVRSMDQRTTTVLLQMTDCVREILTHIEADGTEGEVVIDTVIGAVDAIRNGDVASEVVEADRISCVPPRTADCCCISLPSWDAVNSRIFSLPPLFAASTSANFCTPRLTGWSVLLRWPQRIVRSST